MTPYLTYQTKDIVDNVVNVDIADNDDDVVAQTQLLFSQIITKYSYKTTPLLSYTLHFFSQLDKRHNNIIIIFYIIYIIMTGKEMVVSRIGVVE